MCRVNPIYVPPTILFSSTIMTGTTVISWTSTMAAAKSTDKSGPRFPVFRQQKAWNSRYWVLEQDWYFFFMASASMRHCSMYGYTDSSSFPPSRSSWRHSQIFENWTTSAGVLKLPDFGLHPSRLELSPRMEEICSRLNLQVEGFTRHSTTSMISAELFIKWY